MSARISVLLNGSLQGFLGAQEECARGDPLSSLLFYMLRDFLNNVVAGQCGCVVVEIFRGRVPFQYLGVHLFEGHHDFVGFNAWLTGFWQGL